MDPDAEYTKVPQWKTVFTLFVLFITTVISMNLPIEVSLKFVYLTNPVNKVINSMQMLYNNNENLFKEKQFQIILHTSHTADILIVDG